MIYERLDASDFERRMRESGWNFLNGELIQDLFFYLEDEDGDMEFDAALIDRDFIPYSGWVDLVDEEVIDKHDLDEVVGAEFGEEGPGYMWGGVDEHDLDEAVLNMVNNTGRLVAEADGQYLLRSY